MRPSHTVAEPAFQTCITPCLGDGILEGCATHNANDGLVRELLPAQLAAVFPSLELMESRMQNAGLQAQEILSGKTNVVHANAE